MPCKYLSFFSLPFLCQGQKRRCTSLKQAGHSLHLSLSSDLNRPLPEGLCTYYSCFWNALPWVILPPSLYLHLLLNLIPLETLSLINPFKEALILARFVHTLLFISPEPYHYLMSQFTLVYCHFPHTECKLHENRDCCMFGSLL